PRVGHAHRRHPHLGPEAHGAAHRRLHAVAQPIARRALSFAARSSQDAAMQAGSYSAASAPTSLHTELLDPTAGRGASWLTALKPGKRARELSHARRDGRARGTERAGDVAARHPGPRGALACRLAVDAAARDGGAAQTGTLRRRGGYRWLSASPGALRCSVAP